jgi:hypothetical protein
VQTDGGIEGGHITELHRGILQKDIADRLLIPMVREREREREAALATLHGPAVIRRGLKELI